MSGDGFGINAQSVARTGYFKATGEFKTFTPEEKQQFIDMLRRYHLPQQNDGYELLTDKNGNSRKGRLVKYEPRNLLDMLQGKKQKELAKVKKAQVTKFLESIRALGLDLTINDIMSKNGTLNPNFKVDEKGNISFRNIKGYLNGKTPDYFETKDGEWAAAQKFEYPKWFALKDSDKNLPQRPKLQHPTNKDVTLAVDIDPDFSKISDIKKGPGYTAAVTLDNLTKLGLDIRYRDNLTEKFQTTPKLSLETE